MLHLPAGLGLAQRAMRREPVSAPADESQEGVDNVEYHTEMARLALIETARSEDIDDSTYLKGLLPIIPMDHAVADKVYGKTKKSAMRISVSVHKFDLFSAVLHMLQQSKTLDELKNTDVASFRSKHPQLAIAFADIVSEHSASQAGPDEVLSSCCQTEHAHAAEIPARKNVRWDATTNARVHRPPLGLRPSKAESLDTSGLNVSFDEFYSDVGAEICEEGDDVDAAEETDLEALEEGIRAALDQDDVSEHQEDVAAGADDWSYSDLDSDSDVDSEMSDAEIFDNTFGEVDMSTLPNFGYEL